MYPEVGIFLQVIDSSLNSTYYLCRILSNVFEIDFICIVTGVYYKTFKLYHGTMYYNCLVNNFIILNVELNSNNIWLLKISRDNILFYEYLC